MGYILKNTSGLINTRITDTGRQKISQGNFNISYFQIGDSEVSYNAIPQTQYNQYNSVILEPSFNAQNSAGVPQSNKENIKYPYFVDGNAGNTYGIPFMQSIVSPVYNTASPRGFFLGTTTNSTTLWSAITTGDYALTSNYVIQMNSLNGSNTIVVSSITCNTNFVRNYKVGDIITIIYDGSGVDNCNCYSATTTTTTAPTTTTTTTNPCDPPPPPTTTTTTTCPITNCGPCIPSYSATCVVNMPSCYSILTYRIVDVCLDNITLDRTTPDFSYLSSDCYARVIVYPSGMTEIYDSVTPFQHFPYDVINFESVCYTDQFDVKIWNMNIPWSENPAGLNSATYKDYKQFGSINYLGSKEYFGYASSSGQTDTDSTYYFNSFDEKIIVTPEEQKAIAIIHYTNNTIDFFYGEKFALEPRDITEPEDNTGEARNFKVHLPWIMWHKNPQCCYGQTFYVDPPGFDSLLTPLFEVHYLESTKNEDMNNPGIRYYHLWDTNPNQNSTPEAGIPNRVGKVFPDHKLIIIDDEELVAALSYKSNRNWTLPAPKVSLITPNICGLDNNSVEGILTGSSDYLYVTYRLSNSSSFTNSLHSNYYQLIQGPNVTCNPINSQNVSVRFGNEFGCLSSAPTSIQPCWYTGFTFWVTLDPDTNPNDFAAYPFVKTSEILNGYPVYRTIIVGNDIYNLYFNGTNWIFVNSGSAEDLIVDFDTNIPFGNFTMDNGSSILSGFTDCSYEPLVCVTICRQNISCVEEQFIKFLSGNTELYLDNNFSTNKTIVYSGASWQLFSGNTKIATITGLTQNDVPLGTWNLDVPSVTGVTSTLFEDCLTFSCRTYTAQTISVGQSVIKVVDCDYVISTPITGTSFSGCALTIDGLFDNTIRDVSGTTVVGFGIGTCTTTTTTICPTPCDVFSGFIADKFEMICQKIVSSGRPESTEWKIIDFTDQLTGTSINGYITSSGLTGNTFVITQELYDDAPTYDLSDYIDLTTVGFTGTQLNFGDEYYFYGNIETDIQATIYEMRYQVVLGQSEFQYSSNPSWDSSVQPFVSEIGLYDSDKNLMIISKLQSPYPRTGIQQFVIKLDI